MMPFSAQWAGARERRRDPCRTARARGIVRTKAERDVLADTGADEVIIWITETDAVLDELKTLADELIEA